MNEETNHLKVLGTWTKEFQNQTTILTHVWDELREQYEIYIVVKHKLFKDQWNDRIQCYPDYSEEYRALHLRIEKYKRETHLQSQSGADGAAHFLPLAV